MFAFLQKHGLLESTRGVYDQEHVRFAYRFRAFSQLGSPMVATLQDYRRSMHQYTENSVSFILIYYKYQNLLWVRR
jgi:hypothetical protein